MQGECGCLKVASRLKEGTLRVQATNWAFRFEVTTDGAGVVRYAGAVLLQELADRLGLTRIPGWRGPQGRRRHPDAQVLWKLAVLRADGGDCLCNLAAFGDHSELFGPVASTPTAWRVIKRAAQDRDGLAWLRAAKAYARERGRGAPTPSCSSSTRTRLCVGAQRQQGRCRGHLQGLVRVRAAVGLPGPRGCPGRAAGRHPAAEQRLARRRAR
jgi:hypothetical protein